MVHYSRMAQLDRISTIAFALAALAACGRTPVSSAAREDGGAAAGAERCNGLDDDGDRGVDEDYRDDDGRYLHDAHCGACGRACDAQIANAAEVACISLEGVPSCAATRCAQGFGATRGGSCVPLDDRLCLPCLDDGDCGALGSARCIELAGERRCTRACAGGCPGGYVCYDGDHCIPAAGSCRCQDSALDFGVACVLSEAAGGCPGSARCERGELTVCRAPAESCDGVDNDCDRAVDEDVRRRARQLQPRPAPLRRMRQRLHRRRRRRSELTLRRRSVRAELRHGLPRSRRRRAAGRSARRRPRARQRVRVRRQLARRQRRGGRRRRPARRKLRRRRRRRAVELLRCEVAATMPGRARRHGRCAASTSRSSARSRRCARARRARTCTWRRASTPRACACATACSCTAAIAATSSRSTRTASRWWWSRRPRPPRSVARRW